MQTNPEALIIPSDEETEELMLKRLLMIIKEMFETDEDGSYKVWITVEKIVK